TGGGSLLGYDDYARRKNEEKDRLSAQSEEWLEQSNDAHLDKIGSKISAIKDLSLGIKKEIRDSNTLLDQMESGVAMTGGMLKGSIGRLADMTQTATKKHMLYLIVFVVGLFLTLYYGATFF
ncbi:protein transport protein bet1, putative, partial [Acanthamoeba castellanii str. Neff]